MTGFENLIPNARKYNEDKYRSRFSIGPQATLNILEPKSHKADRLLVKKTEELHCRQRRAYLPFNPIMKYPSLLLFILMLFTSAYSQVCRFEQIAGSNDFIYPQTCVDSLLKPGKYTAIIYGETHTTHFEPVFKFHFLKHLNQSYGYRDVFMECGQAMAWLCNKYLETGDTIYFHPLGIDVKYTPGYMWPGYRKDFWPKLYAYNQTLAPSQRFVFHGTDFERKESLGVLLMLIPPGAVIPQGLQSIFTDIRVDIHDTSWQDFSREADIKYERLRLGFQKADDDVQTLYGEHYALVASIIDNTAIQQTNWRPRNKTMSAEIQRAVEADDIRKMVGFFGSFHTDYRNPSAIPNNVNALSPFKGRTLNITSIYYNAVIYDRSVVPFVRPNLKPGVCAGLYNRFLGKDYRASILSTKTTGEHSVARTADYILLANDTTSR